MAKKQTSITVRRNASRNDLTVVVGGKSTVVELAGRSSSEQSKTAAPFFLWGLAGFVGYPAQYGG